MLVMDVIAECLRREGVSRLFGFPTTPIIEAASAAGIRPVICRQERAGINMADGYSRVNNGRPPGVFAMQFGPGIENGFPGVATAFADSSPVLFLPTGHFRETSQVFPMFKATRNYAFVTKFVEELVLPEQVAVVMRRAFGQLRNGRPGPVMVEVPRDVVEFELANPPSIGGLPVAKPRSAPDAGDVAAAAKLLLEGRCPMILAGQGVLYAEASAELSALADLLQVPVMTTIAGKSAFPENHPLSLGAGARVLTGDAQHFLKKSDVVLGIGTSLTRYVLTNPPLPPGKRIIHATLDPRDLHKAYDTEVAILGDAKLILAQLVAEVRDRLGGRSRDRAAAAELGRLRREWLAGWEPKLRSAQAPITPYRVIAEFMEAVNPAEAIVTHDSGSPRNQLIPFYKATTPRGYIGWGKSHALGSGLGLMIGAKLAAPDKFCVNFMGDAAFGMTGLDFETAVRSDAPILTVVFNNSTMACETNTMQVSNARYGTRALGGNYAGLARDMGGWSERVEEPARIRGAILEAREQTRNGRAALLEFITSEETASAYVEGRNQA